MRTRAAAALLVLVPLALAAQTQVSLAQTCDTDCISGGPTQVPLSTMLQVPTQLNSTQVQGVAVVLLCPTSAPDGTQPGSSLCQIVYCQPSGVLTGLFYTLRFMVPPGLVGTKQESNVRVCTLMADHTQEVRVAIEVSRH